MRRLLLIALVALMPVTGVFSFGSKRANMAAADMLVPVAMLFLLWRIAHGKGRFPQFGLFCLSTSLVAMSGLLNIEASLAAKGAIGMWVEFLKLTVLWVYFYLVTNFIETREDLVALLKTWTVSSAAVALTGIGGALAYQATGRENPFALMFRAQGTLGDSNLFATFLGMSFFVALYYRNLKTPRPRWVMVPMALQVAGIFFSASRGGLLYFSFSLLVLFFISSRMTTRVAGVAALVVMSVVIMAIPDKGALLQANTFTDRMAASGASDRIELWRSAAERFQTSPLFGIGRGNFRLLDQRDPTKTGQVHNTYLEILCELGLVGLVVYAAFVGKHFAALFSRRSDPGSRLLMMALVTVLLCGLTISIGNFRGAWMLVGLVDAHQRFHATTA